MVAFGERVVVVRADDPAVLDALEHIFSMMPAPVSGQTVGELEVCREDDRYVVRGSCDGTVEARSLALAVRCARYSVIQLLMNARLDLLWFHAGAAVFRERAVLFPGPPGGGKSTLVTGLCARRWSYLSDEIAPLDPRCHTVLPFPQAPVVRQYPGREMPPEWVRSANKTSPGLRPDSLCREPRPVAAVVCLSYRRDARAELAVGSSATTALRLLEQCPNALRHGEMAVSYVCALVQRVPCFSVCFSDGGAAVDVVARELEGRL